MVHHQSGELTSHKHISFYFMRLNLFMILCQFCLLLLKLFSFDLNEDWIYVQNVKLLLINATRCSTEWQEVEIEIHLNSNNYYYYYELIITANMFFVWWIACKVGQRTQNAIKCERVKKIFFFFLRPNEMAWDKHKPSVLNKYRVHKSDSTLDSETFGTWKKAEQSDELLIVLFIKCTHICIAVKITFISIWRHLN